MMLRNWWYTYRGALTPQECVKVVKIGMESGLSPATVGHGSSNYVDPNVRHSLTAFIPRTNMELMPIFHKLHLIGHEANAAGFGFDLQSFGGAQFTVYQAPGQHYRKHIDLNWKPDPLKARSFDRKMSMVVQLSPPETYEGGKLLLENDPLPEGRFHDIGDAVFFPAFNPHEVTPVTAGIRYSLVAWFEGPPFR